MIKTFAELQNMMNMKKQQGKAVSYSYRSAEQILQHFKSLDSGWDIMLTDYVEEIGGKLFIRSVAAVSTGTIHQSAQAFAELSETPVLKLKAGGERKQMTDPQWTGAVSSYARKYALQGLFGIADIDIDELEAEQEVIRAKTRDFIAEIKSANNEAQVNKIAKEAKAAGRAQEVLEAYNERMEELKHD